MDILAFSVVEFCTRHSISRSKFYLLMDEGLAPSTFFVGNRRLISVESAKQWRADMQNRTHQQNLSRTQPSAEKSAAVVSSLPLLTLETQVRAK